MKVINISVLTGKIIRLGRRGEGNVRQIVFDCTCFEETYGSRHIIYDRYMDRDYKIGGTYVFN